MSFKLRATNLQNVAPGNTATLKLPVGKNAPTLDKIILELSGGMLPEHIESIRGKANGRLFMDEASGTVLNLRDTYRGVFTSSAFLTIDFTEKSARNGAVEQLLSSVPMSLLQDLAFEIKIAAGAPALGRIDAQIIVRQPTNNPFILKKLNTTSSFANSGEQIMYLPTGGAGGKVKRIWIHEGTDGTVTDLQIRVGNSIAYETNRAKLEHAQKQNDLTPQTGVVVLDFVEDGNLSGVLDTGNAANVELRITSSAANTYTVWYEFIDPIGRL
jgi:hypothetical protein